MFKGKNGNFYGKDVNLHASAASDGIFVAGYYEGMKSYTMLSHVNLANVTAAYTAQTYDCLYGTLGSEVQISIADNAVVWLGGITINGGDDWNTDWAGITCEGNATINLADGTTNLVKPFCSSRAAISVPSGKTLAIQGSGSLTADARDNSGNGAGIGGGDSENYGEIEITGDVNVTAYGGFGAAGIGSGSAGFSSVIGGDITISTSGTVTATGGEQAAGIGSGATGQGDNSCGNILISKGTVVATGGEHGAGIGTGYKANDNSICGTITITDGVTKVTATKGESAYDCIGRGNSGSCGTVTIGGTVYWGPKDSDPTWYEYKNDGDTYLKQNMLIYEP